MKIIEWNSQGGFRNKNGRILSLLPDIAIIAECESENKLRFGDLTPIPNDFLWYGESENKGIGIFSYSDYKFELLQTFNPKFKFVIPMKVVGKDYSFLLFAIWAMNNKENPESSYIGQIWLAINFYTKYFSLPCILAGDFNSNKIWDKKDRIGNHSDMVRFLENKNIYSLYHKQQVIEQGKEVHPTFHLYRKLYKPYHIDYFFASETIISNGFEMEIGKIENWIDISDHLPLILNVEIKTRLDGLDDSLCDFVADKLSGLSNETRGIFTEIINNLTERAREIECIKDLFVQKEERRRLIVKCEKLLEIDKLMGDLKK